uniref:DUF4939 domain-containing protein n=1 Tax=Neolamprologus brichardi TaxID=32507 RepID=A0A3Q4G7I1_NEOBR
VHRTITFLQRFAWWTSLAKDRSLPAPEPFSGEFDKCIGFLTQITLQFRQLQRTYETDGAKIAFMVQLLRGQALNWAQAVLRTAPDISYEDFLTKCKCF